MLNKIFIVMFALSTFFYVQAEEITNNEDGQDEVFVDCLILEDENSIICKFNAQRQTKDQEIIVQWIDPQGEVSRSREMIVPSGHGSIYDYRYKDGRVPGEWTFKVITDEKEYTTTFELK
ncbi:MAG: hypothetical protein ACQERD_04480 [Campylobacterota bacterium]